MKEVYLFYSFALNEETAQSWFKKKNSQILLYIRNQCLFMPALGYAGRFWFIFKYLTQTVSANFISSEIRSGFRLLICQLKNILKTQINYLADIPEVVTFDSDIISESVF